MEISEARIRTIAIKNTVRGFKMVLINRVKLKQVFFLKLGVKKSLVCCW